MPAAYLVAACRTPIGKLLGGLSRMPAPALVAIAIREALVRARIAPDDVDEVILGQVLQAGVGQAPARQAALGAGLPSSVAAVTINKVCGSGLKAVMLADQAIRAGDARILVAGGMESMSRAPFLAPDMRAGNKFGDSRMLDSMLHDGLWCAFEDVGMGSIADATARRTDVSRAEQDRFAVESHRRAIAAQQAGRFREEIVPVRIAGGRGETIVSDDEGPRSDASLESLAKLRPAFDADGSVTAGNASQISDGAAAVVVVHEDVARTIDSPLRAKIVATATSGVDPRDIFLAPIHAVRRVLEKARLQADDIDLFELNEAFAVQCAACLKGLRIDEAKVNVHGGAIALGHPIGASGSRILVTLLHALHQRGLRRGLASLCLGGGNAVAMIVERG